jgi:hypothetical protein
LRFLADCAIQLHVSPQRRAANPFRKFREALHLTHAETAEALGCSVDLAKKLSAELQIVVSPPRALDFEKRTQGAIRYSHVMLWTYDRLRHGPVRWG